MLEYKMHLCPELKDIQQLHHMRMTTDAIQNDRLSQDLIESVVGHFSQPLDGYSMIVGLSGASKHLAETAIAQSNPKAVQLGGLSPCLIVTDELQGNQLHWFVGPQLRLLLMMPIQRADR
jgi:hypothetical protein